MTPATTARTEAATGRLPRYLDAPNPTIVRGTRPRDASRFNSDRRANRSASSIDSGLPTGRITRGHARTYKRCLRLSFQMASREAICTVWCLLAPWNARASTRWAPAIHRDRRRVTPPGLGEHDDGLGLGLWRHVVNDHARRLRHWHPVVHRHARRVGHAAGVRIDPPRARDQLRFVSEGHTGHTRIDLGGVHPLRHGPGTGVHQVTS